ncbi:Nucleotide-binding universal stress protein, UspA family [Flagellimonas taeanensis]|uniref:Nucleotide-binding universal stress protein, UspA family n=1 Tax=Flagellimonas taeanensis TaxID=1005926 RepID=A0A1M6UPF9_9FLAO|nr:universal stress protein [Allomuricauda taeanensis]SFC54235.1 Nucleotide-binding universal stress protein, UspA family [Allomuricauda taeanensis]SHK71074.1 Nucleotide-binding universal stress protein, UspA family [Allomuricauda taeanensis]
MKNILVPTDFSENSKNALKYAQMLFGLLECNFYVLYVGTLLDVKADTEALVDIGDGPTGSTKQQLQELLDESRKHSTNADHSFYALHEYGFFIPTIKRHLEEKEIDLIVMGTKGVSGLKEKVVGSTAGDVIIKVQCNTLLVPSEVEYTKPMEIAFPTDFNIFYSHGMLRSMSEMMYLGKGNFRIMNAKKEGVELNMEQKGNKEFLLDYMEETFPDRYSFHSLTNKSAKLAIQCFVESRNIDMMVMVAKNLNFIQQILFDSLTEKISFHTKIPFYVIHE